MRNTKLRIQIINHLCFGCFNTLKKKTGYSIVFLKKNIVCVVYMGLDCKND